MDDTLQNWFELLIQEHQRAAFDALHAYFLTQAGFIAAYAGNYLGLPSVVSARGNDLERAAFDPVRAAHILFALQHADAVTTNANELARKARAFVPGLDVTVIPNGIDSDHFRPTPRNPMLAEQFGINTKSTKEHEDIKTIGFVGELRMKKGLVVLLNGYTQVAINYPSCLLITGDVRSGEDKQYFDDFRSTNPDSKIVLTGYVSPADMPAYYALMDIFVHPSLRDGLPNALLEAMACERAVIATPVGGILDVLADRENGMLVPVNDPDALAQSIAKILSDRNLALQYGQAARATVLNQFTLAAELEGNLKVYRNLGLKV